MFTSGPRSGSEPVRLSTDGKEGLAYGRLSWSPDSKTLAAFRIEPGDHKEVYLIQSSPPGGGRAKFTARPYPLPGDKFTAYELNLFDIAAKKQTKPKVDRIDYDDPHLRWNKDGRHFTYEKVDRGHQRFRVVEVDAHTGAAAEPDRREDRNVHLDRTCRERRPEAGQLARQDRTRSSTPPSATAGGTSTSSTPRQGEIKNPITRGEYVVRGIDLIDEEKRQVWFRAGGKNPGQDPYFLHYYRVNFDGTGLVALTEGNGTHSVQFSPDRAYLIDTYSRVDMPPGPRAAPDLRRIARVQARGGRHHGTQGQRLGAARGVRRQGPRRQDRHLGRHRPAQEPRPVAGSTRSSSRSTPVRRARTFPRHSAPSTGTRSLTDLGFIVVQIDGMGTANRSKAFHDVCWHNLKDAGFPDRILWHKAAAAKYPYYDLSRAGHLRSLGRRPERHRRRALSPRVLQGRPSRHAAATTTAWTKPHGTSNGWDTPWGPGTPSPRTSTTPTGSAAS